MFEATAGKLSSTSRSICTRRNCSIAQRLQQGGSQALELLHQQAFPETLDVQRLPHMLQTPPTCYVPVTTEDLAMLTEHWDQAILPGLFSFASHENGDQLAHYLSEALMCPYLHEDSTEMEYVDFWRDRL